jgi:hypothetical protein
VEEATTITVRLIPRFARAAPLRMDMVLKVFSASNIFYKGEFLVITECPT